VTAPKPRLRDVEAYLAEMDRVDAANVGGAHYADEVHGINDLVLRRSGVGALTAAIRAVLARVDRWEQGQAENREALLHGGWCPYDPPSPADFRAALSAHISLEES